MYDICIIGCGRVGLPLALSFREKGYSVIGYDLDVELKMKVDNGRMPFDEPQYEKLLNLYDDFTIVCSHIPEAKTYIITVGTPLGQHIETDTKAIESAIGNLVDSIDISNKNIILRSTVAPGTSRYLKKLIQNNTGKTSFNFGMCPERLAEGKAYEEIHSLPQIIGADTWEEQSEFCRYFDSFGVECLQTSLEEAELSKLFCNIFRYIHFAIPNYFAYIAEQFGVDAHHLLNTIKKDYPRAEELASPGFTGGTCLRKDFGMINEHFPQTDIILQAYKINEFMPKFCVDLCLNNGIDLSNCRVGILGYTMKRDSDDVRDTLVIKLINYLKYYNTEIFVHEPNINSDYITDEQNNFYNMNYSLDKVLNKTDIIFVGTNHSDFDNLDIYQVPVVDLWNQINGQNKLIKNYNM